MKLSQMEASRHSLRGWLLCLAAAVGLWLGFPNDFISFPPLVLAWPVALTLLGREASSRAQALRLGWLATIAGGIAALYWLTLPVHNVGGLPWLLAIPCALFIVTCIGSVGGLFAVAAHVLRARPAGVQAVLMGLLWYILQTLYARALGFPWLDMAGALSPWPVLVQAADVVGGYALTGLWTMAALLCCLGFADSARRYCPNRASLVPGLLLAAVLLCYGGWRLHANPLNSNPTGPQSIDVLFVEGNVDQNQKWVPAFQRQTVDLYLGLTYNALAENPGAKPLIIWPETALPFFFEANGLHSPRIRELAAHTRNPVLFGAPGMERHPGKREPDVFNRAFLLGPNGDTVGYYDKEHLVPFGEYLPEWLNWGFLEALLQGVGVYQTGTAIAPLRHDNLALGMLICYEGIFPWIAQNRVADGANILVDISNDGWFGNTPAARQHLYLTALRAVEQNRWILRGTNTGISVVVDSRGRLTMQGGQFKAQAVWGKAALESTPSLFHMLSPWLLPLAASAFLGLLLFGPGGSIARRRAAQCP